MKVSFSHYSKLASDITSIYLDAESAFEYLAGQYVEVKFSGETYSSIGDNRWFTLSSSPSEKQLMITTRLNKPLSEFKSRFLTLKKGDELILSEPLGTLVLPKDSTIPLFFVCGGIGITPARSIIKWLIDNNERRDITLHFFASKKEDLIFNDVLSQYQMNYLPIITKAKQINIKNEIARLNPKPKTLFYVSGPRLMVEDIAEFIGEKYGYDQVVMDYFPGYDSV